MAAAAAVVMSIAIVAMRRLVGVAVRVTIGHCFDAGKAKLLRRMRHPSRRKRQEQCGTDQDAQESMHEARGSTFTGVCQVSPHQVSS